MDQPSSVPRGYQGRSRVSMDEFASSRASGMSMASVRPRAAPGGYSRMPGGLDGSSSAPRNQSGTRVSSGAGNGRGTRGGGGRSGGQGGGGMAGGRYGYGRRDREREESPCTIGEEYDE